MDHVLDASAIVALLEGEEGGDKVRNLISDPAELCYAHAVNLAEVHYHIWRRVDEQAADQAIAQLISDGVLVREDMDDVFWKSISRLKVGGNISIADCVCIALAQRLNAEILTTHHREFDPLVPRGICPITFIR